MIEQGVIGLLLGATPPALAGARAAAQAAVVAAVGVKVFPSKAPSDTAAPYVCVWKAGADHTKHLGGRAGLAKTQVVIVIYHPLYATAEAVAENVRLLLDGYSGPLPNGLRCLGIFQDDDQNDWQPPAHADEQGMEKVELRLKVIANET